MQNRERVISLSKKIKVMLDPGHSLLTPGKRSGSFLEYLSNREIAIKAKHLLELNGFAVAFSVNLDSPADALLSTRAQAAVNWDADLFISIHSNAHSDPKANGTETFVHTGSTASIPVAQKVQDALLDALGTRNRGVKKANFGVLRGTYKHMLSILTEGEFFTNPEQRAWMVTEDYSSKYAEGIAKGVCAFYKVKYNGKVVPVAKPKPIATPAEGNVTYKDMVVVKASELFTYNSKDWNDKGPIVKQGEAFTVVATHKVNGGTMYELLSGLYVTANTKWVTLKKGAIEAVPVVQPKAPSVKGKRVEAIVAQVNYYNTPRWTNPSGQFTKGMGWTIVDTVTTQGSKQFKVKNSKGAIYYITARPDLVRVI